MEHYIRNKVFVSPVGQHNSVPAVRSAQQLLDYHDTTYERMKTYFNSLSAAELARDLR